MTADEITRLLYLAECADTGHPWRNGADPCHFDAPEVTDDKTFSYYVTDDKKAEYIAALQPKKMIPLLKDLQAALKREAEGPKAIRMRLPCENCGELHIDEGKFATKPHHTHQCARCGLVWRPAEEFTVGVRFVFQQAAPRVFERSNPDPDSGLLFETCKTCGKHIRHHYGDGKDGRPAQRCDPAY